MKWTQNKKKEPICNQRNFWSYSIIKCYILISISNWLVNIPFTNLFWCWIYLNFVMIINLERHHQTNTTYSRKVNAIQFKDDVHHLTQLSLLLCRGDVRKLHNRLWCLISEQSPLGAAPVLLLYWEERAGPLQANKSQQQFNKCLAEGKS